MSQFVKNRAWRRVFVKLMEKMRVTWEESQRRGRSQNGERGDPHSWQQGPWPMQEAQPGPAEEPAGAELGFRSKANPGEWDTDETSRRGPRAGITVLPGT